MKGIKWPLKLRIRIYRQKASNYIMAIERHTKMRISTNIDEFQDRAKTALKNIKQAVKI